ncbi:protein SRG1-like [Triticum dicoccoides]|uniref:protein SRG1-like n=1 Tax=Triticum dicoccoides TaxID=85692 RepID=UPI000E7BB6A8|nr:protein SRG1-like [Triticum dicoccoides]
MESAGDKVMSRAQITDTFTDSTVIPDRYVQSDEAREGVVVGDDESYELPVVDMAMLLDPEFSEAEIAKLGSACQDWGFFQLTNHGVDETVVQDIKNNTMQFFGLPLEKKKAVAIEAGGLEGFGHHYSRASCEKLDWAECLILVTEDNVQRNTRFWPADPSTFRYALEKYAMEISDLTSRLVPFMASDLGVEQETLVETFQGKRQSVAFHYYPPCPHPDKVIGIMPHHDAFGLTLLLQVDNTPGLQVRKNGTWHPVNPLPGALVINVGDMLQILTNGTYKSVEHRVLPDAEKGRATVVMFQHACVAGMVKPLPELGEATYKAIEKLEYVKGSSKVLAEGIWFVDTLKIM